MYQNKSREGMRPYFAGGNNHHMMLNSSEILSGKAFVSAGGSSEFANLRNNRQRQSLGKGKVTIGTGDAMKFGDLSDDAASQ